MLQQHASPARHLHKPGESRRHFRPAEVWMLAVAMLAGLSFAAIGSWFACGGNIAGLHPDDLERASVIVLDGFLND